MRDCVEVVVAEYFVCQNFPAEKDISAYGNKG